MSLAALTQQDIRDKVRVIMDLDEIDLPDGVVDTFTRDAFEQIDGRYSRWPHREYTVTYTTVVGDNDIAFTDIDSKLDDIRSIISSAQGGFLMQMISQEAADEFYASTTTTGLPIYWSVTGDNTLHLYPVPNSPTTLRIRGFRTARNWLSEGAGGIPDLPVAFHTSLSYKVIALAYAQTEDPELAALWDSYYKAAAAVAEEATFRPTEASPRFLHGHRWNYPYGGVANGYVPRG